MTRILATIVASAAFVVSAYAGTVEGEVKTFDPATRTITLDDGNAYVAAEGVTVDGLAEGAKVKVTFDDGTMTATSVELL